MLLIARLLLALSRAIPVWTHEAQRLKMEFLLSGIAFDLLRNQDQLLASTKLIPRLQTLAQALYPETPTGIEGAQIMLQNAAWAVALIKCGETAAGEDLLQAVSSWFSAQPKQTGERWGACLMNFGCELLELDHAAAIDWLVQARDVLLSSAKTDSEIMLQCRSNLGVALQMRGRLAESAEELTAVVQGHRAKSKWQSDESISAENNLAQTLLLLGLPDEAMEHARRAVDLAQKWRDRRFASTLDTLADVYEAQNKPLEALHTRAGAIAKLESQGQERSKAIWLEKQAALLHRMGRNREAEQHQQALERLQHQIHLQLTKTTRAGNEAAG